MLGHWILDDHGQPVEVEVYDEFGNLDMHALLRWARWFETADRHIAKTDVGPFWISTVFLGLDHNFGEDRAPKIFETMVFDNERRDLKTAVEAVVRMQVSHDTDLGDEGFWGIMWRYSTREEAEQGHAAAVERCRAHLDAITEEVERMIAHEK